MSYGRRANVPMIQTCSLIVLLHVRKPMNETRDAFLISPCLSLFLIRSLPRLLDFSPDENQGSYMVFRDGFDGFRVQMYSQMGWVDTFDFFKSAKTSIVLADYNFDGFPKPVRTSTFTAD